MIQTGVDLVRIPQFGEKIKDQDLLKRLFTDEEIERAGSAIETLAGMFAAKEAYFKAVRHTPEWHAVSVAHNEDGSPEIRLHNSASVREKSKGDVPRASASLSISHDGEYAVAVVIINDH